MLKKIKYYFILIRFNKPIGFFLLLWPTLSGIFINIKNIPSIKCSIIFFIGIIIMRSLGCAINDFIDRNHDKYVVRTKKRPLTSGLISLNETLILIIIMSILSFFIVLQLNINSILFSPFIFLLIIIYPFCKRFLKIPQLILGLSFSLSIILSYIMEKKFLDLPGFILFFSTILWAIIYDTEYAMIDKKEDIKINLKSSAIYFGTYDKNIVFLLQVIHFILYMYFFYLLNIYLILFILLFFSITFIIYQQYLINKNNSKYYLLAFLNNNYYGLFLNISIILYYCILL